MSNIVLVQQLKKSYRKVTAVKDISFTLKTGEIFGLLGPNGAGKTTTLRCLCTLMTPDAGQLEIAGIDVIAQPRLARQKLGYVAQEVALDKMLTGRELLQLQAALYHIPNKIAKDRIEQVIKLLSLEEWSDRKTGTYSGGLKKRLDLAAGLLHQPLLLVLDEPTVGLDIESRLIMWKFLKELKSNGTTILITSHYLEEIDALADRVAIIDQGIVIASGTPSQLKDQVGGDRITLKTREFTPKEEAQQLKAILENLPSVKEIIINELQGNSLNLVVTPDPQNLNTIQQTLKEANFPLFGISQSRPSLDDVYLAATGQTLQDAELAAISLRDLKAEKKESMR